MAIVSDVEIRLRADIARLQQDLTRARNQVSSFTSGVKSLVGNLFAGFAIGSVISQVVGAQREFDKLHSSLITVTGSSAGASKAFEAIQKLAAQTPFDLAQVTEGFLKLRNLGLTPSERAIMSYGNTASAMNKTLIQMVEAVADATVGQFERLKEFGIDASKQGDKIALTFQGSTKTIGNNAKEIEAYLMAIGETQFAGGMERQAATLDGALSNLGDTFKMTLTQFSQGSGFGNLVQGSVLALTESLADLGAMFKAIGGAADDEGEKVKAIGPIHAFLTTTFEALTVVGTNIAYVFKTIGKDIGAFAAQAVTLFNGGFSGLVNGSTLKAVQDIGRARVEEAKKERAEVDATSERILGAAAKRQEQEKKDAEARKNGAQDYLGTLKIVGDGVKGLSDKEKKAAADRAKEDAKRLQSYRELESQVQQRVDASARELAGLAELTEAEKFDLQLTEDIRLGKRELTKEQEARIRAMNAEAGANLILAKSQKEYDDMLAMLADNAKEAAQERERLVDSARQEAEQNEWLVETFGKTESAIIRMEAARIREQMVQKLGRALTAEEIADLERVAELKERSAKAVTKKEELEKVRSFWASIDQTAHDTFVSIADGGKDLGKRLRDTLKNTFFDWLYQQTLRKWIINIGTSISGTAGVSGIANAAGMGGAGGAGILGTVGNLYSSLSGGMTLAGGLGSGFLGSLAGGLNGAGIGSGLTSSLGLSLGNSIAGVLGPSVSGAISSGLSTLAAAAPWVAGAVAVFTLAKKAFGHGPKEMTGTSTLSGWINSAGGLDANNYADWTKKGGWLSSDKGGSDRLPVDAELAKGILDTYNTIKVSTMDYAKALGLNADMIANRAQGLYIAFGKDEEANKKALTDFFSTAADQVAREVLPSLDLFIKDGETAATALQRMATNSVGLDQALAVMGTTMAAVFGETNNVSLLARERVVELAGGVQNLTAMAAYFQQNILTEADRVAATQGPLQKALESLGYANLKTTEDFKKAVLDLQKDGQLLTEEGAKRYAGLLALAPQFKMVADYMAQLEAAAADLGKTVDEVSEALPDLELIRRRRELEIEIMDLQGQTAEALAARRKMELDEADASLRPLIERVHALEDEREAADAAAEATRRYNEQLAESVANTQSALTGLVDRALAAVQRAVQAQKDRVTAAYKETMAGLEKSISSVNDTIKRTGELSKALRGAIQADPGENSAARAQVARAEITAALAIARASGVLPTAESLADALAAVGMDSSDDFATLAEYQRAVARTNAELEALGGMSDKELTNAEKQLKVLEDQKAATTAAYEAELARLDRILAQAQAQVDAVKGVDNSVRSVEAAVAALGTAIGALKTAPVQTPTGPAGGIVGNNGRVTVEDLYRQVLGRSPDAAGLEFWKKAFGDAVDQSEYLDFVKSARPELDTIVNGPPNVAGGSGTMSSSAAMVSELQTLNSRMANVETQITNTATATGQFAQQFHQVSGGGNLLGVEVL